VQPFCLALNRKAANKGWKKAAEICAVPVADHQMKTWAQLFEGRLALNPGLNLTRVSFSCVQKLFLG